MNIECCVSICENHRTALYFMSFRFSSGGDTELFEVNADGTCDRPAEFPAWGGRLSPTVCIPTFCTLR